MKVLSLTLILTFSSSAAFGQAVDVTDSSALPKATAPATGTGKAKEYFQTRQGQAPAPASSSESGGGTPRFMAVHLGTFFSDQAYKWGKGNQEDIAGLNAGFTYRLGEWVNSADFALRFDYTNFSLDEGSARKLSFSGLLSIPDSNSRFPLYFGGGAGLGIFMKQIKKESPLSFDWSLYGGVRFLDVFENVGVMVEAGMKNHILLASDGQFNGIFVNVGTVFAF